MKGLYDIHCHILPGVDDGARNTEEILDAEQGISGGSAACNP